MYDFELIRVANDDGVLTALLDNPPVNLITRQLFRELRLFADEVAVDPEARVVVLRSADPDFFLAHFDVTLILGFPVEGEAQRATEISGFHRMCERFRTMPKPTICEIAGRVGGGGGELAASCDMRFGALGRTTLCQMEVPLGILPGGTGTQRLPALLGRGRAMEVVLGGDDIDAAMLERWGWLNRALAADDLTPFVDRLEPWPWPRPRSWRRRPTRRPVCWTRRTSSISRCGWQTRPIACVASSNSGDRRAPANCGWVNSAARSRPCGWPSPLSR